MSKYPSFMFLDMLDFLLLSGKFDEAEDSIIRWSAKYQLTMEVQVKMWAIQLFNLARNAGVQISPWAAVKAIKEAGESGDYDSVKAAVDSQETWCRAVEIQRGIDPDTGKVR